MNNVTRPTKITDIKRMWHLIDVKGQTLGRVSTQIAKLLMGKSKPYFVRNLDVGDYVVVINAKEVKVTGKKETQKTYIRHSGYPGGFKSRTLAEVRQQQPTEIIRHAVAGMLPDNHLKARMLKRLRIYANEQHEFENQLRNNPSF